MDSNANDNRGDKSMANNLKDIPNFKLAIDDPEYFIGRASILREVCQSPREIRILLGGRRIGKTSFLQAIQWNLLDTNFDKSIRTFPVLINLQVEQPTSIDNLRYILVSRLREAMEKWQKVPESKLREMYQSYIRQVVDGEIGVNFLQLINVKVKVENPDRERRLIHDDFRRAMLQSIDDLKKSQFNGVCFLFDRAEFIAQQKEWASDAWSYFRGLKDTEPSLKPFLGFILSGYRELKEYQQEVGSPLLNIADISWLGALTDSEVTDLILCRQKNEGIQFQEKSMPLIVDWSGGHPYLTQQIVDVIFDKFRANEKIQVNDLKNDLLQQHDHDFSKWWNIKNETGGLSDNERKVYYALISQRQGEIKKLSNNIGLSPLKTKQALEVLVGSGVIRKLNDGVYRIGSSLFEDWVNQQQN